MGFAVRVVVNAVAIWAAVEVLPELEFTGDLWKLLAVALVLAVVNALLRPIVSFGTKPINFLTLGLFTFVVNAAMLLVTAAISDNFALGFSIGGYPPDLSLAALWWAVLASVVMSVVSTAISWAVR